MTYKVETSYPYEFASCETLTEARKKVREFKKKGKKAFIVVVTEMRKNDITKSING